MTDATELPGLPGAARARRRARCPPGTFDGVAVLVTGGGTGLGKAIALEFARLGASIVIASRKPEHLEAGHEAIDALGAPVTHGRRATSATPSRSPPRSTPPSRGLGLPGVLVNNAAANFPVPAEDMSPNAWRTVVDITLNGTFFCAREFARRHLDGGHAGVDRQRRRVVRVDRRPGLRPLARRPRPGVKNMTETLAVEWGPYGIQVNGLVPGLFPHEDMTADIKGNLDRTTEKDVVQPALRVGQLRELGLGGDVPGVALRPVHLRPHARGRRRQLAAPLAHQPAGRHRPRADGQGPVRALIVARVIVDTHVHVVAARRGALSAASVGRRVAVVPRPPGHRRGVPRDRDRRRRRRRGARAGARRVRQRQRVRARCAAGAPRRAWSAS